MNTYQEDAFDIKNNIIDSDTPIHNVLSARYKKSFAYYTMRERYPVILNGIIDNFKKNNDEICKLYNGEETSKEIEFLIDNISQLIQNLQTNKKFEKFSGEEPDKEVWNSFIQQLDSNSNSFFHSCWLCAECYVYRKLYSFFEGTKSLKTYDYFAKQKQTGLDIKGIPTIARVIRYFGKTFKTFDKLIKLNLWGNKCDLSIVLPKQFKPDENIFDELDSFNDNILANGIEDIWKCLESANRSKPVIVEFICDNAGFELFTDLILAGYLIEKQLASKVRFSVKAMPWFISDALSSDITWTLDYLSKHKTSDVKKLAEKWKHYFEESKFVVSPTHYFWVSPYEFYRMREIAPDLYQYLSECHLIIFKGDLNYRKLLGEMKWDPTDEFITCIRGFRPTNFCTFRTLKSDLVCGLSQGKAEELNRLDSQWMTSGEYGVVQFMEGRCCDCLNSEVK